MSRITEQLESPAITGIGRGLLTFEHHIDGRSVPPAGGQYLETENPYTGKPWARFARGTVEDVDLAVAAAHKAFTEGPWRRTTPTQRAELLRRLGDLIKENTEELARAEVRDNGKTITEMRGQMRNMA